MLRIRYQTEDWRELLVSHIDDAETLAGVEFDDASYDEVADELLIRVLRRLTRADVEYEPAGQQSVGSYVILQRGGSDAERAAFGEAVEAELPRAIKDITEVIRLAKEELAELED